MIWAQKGQSSGDAGNRAKRADFTPNPLRIAVPGVQKVGWLMLPPQDHAMCDLSDKIEGMEKVVLLYVIEVLCK